ncbi:MAG: hypothetical protein M1826_006621 [Phylliscum demangeonii]|nr:MAG: hypothetical protein M1826_006621 [Phylliscum demangeonii]
MTDYLQSVGVSAREINQRTEQRRQAAAALAGQEQADAANPAEVEDPEQTRRQRLAEEKGIAAIKKRRGFFNYKWSTPAEAERATELARKVYLSELSESLVPGQLENCAMCSKRFTVTSYTIAGPDGGLLCPKCAKSLRESDPKKPDKKPARGGNNRRQKASEKLDGGVMRGAKSLVQLCSEKIAEYADDLEELGELSPGLLDKLARIFAKRRILNSRTVMLFVRPEFTTISIYDGAYLKSNDYLKIFKICPGVKEVTIKEGLAFKDEVLQYVADHPSLQLEKFRVSGANLIGDETWRHFFKAKGRHLTDIELGFQQNFFDDDTFRVLVEQCPNLRRLKIEKLWHLTAASIEALAGLKHLTHLHIVRPFHPVPSAALMPVLQSVGGQLQELSLYGFSDCDDALLVAIHDECTALAELSLTDNMCYTDQAFVYLFENWSNRPLAKIDLGTCRQVDARNATANDAGIGLCGAGFQALMAHSGGSLRDLVVVSCRHVEHDALCAVFDGQPNRYPVLSFVDLSFCEAIDDLVMAGLFRSCPKLKEVWALGCFKVSDVVVPRDVTMMGGNWLR